MPRSGNRQNNKAMGRAEKDLVALGIAVAAILLFVGTGSSVLPQIARAWLGKGGAPDMMLANALLLNIALVIFGWRRYRELTDEVAMRREAERSAKHAAATDPLTGWLNRRAFHPSLASMLADRTPGQGVGVLAIDFDNFKQINDLGGHEAGDRLLATIAGRLDAATPADALLARLGGDEFAIAVKCDAMRPENLDVLAERVQAAISQPIPLDGPRADMRVTASIGIAYSRHGNQVHSQELLHHADVAMYHAKRHGKGHHVWFEEQMETELRLRQSLERGIRKGIECGEFVPYFEQQVDLETGELTGFEMLARWNSADLGIVSPDIFIPIAEDLGLIAELSEQVVARALEVANEWSPHLTLSVNISPVQLADPWFAQKILKLMTHAGFAPERLEIEITETAIHQNIGNVQSVLQSLRNQGVTVSLDDFGTGYANIAQLRSLPFDRLKIDRSFMRELSKQSGDRQLVEAIVALGRNLALPMTAEGVENEGVLDALKQFGTLKGQGYHYGRPMDEGDTRALLAREGLLADNRLNVPQPPSDAGESRKEERKAG